VLHEVQAGTVGRSLRKRSRKNSRAMTCSFTEDASRQQYAHVLPLNFLLAMPQYCPACTRKRKILAPALRLLAAMLGVSCPIAATRECKWREWRTAGMTPLRVRARIAINWKLRHLRHSRH
jgi:hypothetical protein